LNFNAFTFGKRIGSRKFALLKSGAGSVRKDTCTELVYIPSASAPNTGNNFILILATSIVHKMELAASPVKAKLTILKIGIFFKNAMETTR